jgi:hypothetical protein
MTYRRRHRWLRRLALGLALTTAAALGGASAAFAKGQALDQGGALAAKDLIEATGSQSQPEGSYLSHRQLEELAASRPSPKPDGEQTLQVIPYLSHGITTPSQAPVPEWQMIPHRVHGNLVEALSSPSSRPDDVADRFAHSDVAPQPRVSDGGWTFDPTDVLVAAIGGFVLTIGLGFALGVLRRPRIVGP